MTSIAEVLRRALAPPRPDPPLPAGDPAAVLIPILDADDPSVLLTLRTDDVRHHPGEISFPGGARHAEDDDLVATALRETQEELGIPPDAVDVLGALPSIHTFVSGYVVHPVVGMLQERPEVQPNPVEVAEVLELDLARLAEVEGEVERTGPEGTYYSFVYEIGGHVVWGATARILHTLFSTLRQEGWTWPRT